MPKPPLPEIQILKAIQPTETPDGRLSSPNLEASLREYEHVLGDAWAELMGAEPDSLEEQAAAETLAKIYFLKTSRRLSSPDPAQLGRDRDLWAKRFTESSTTLYEAPEAPFVAAIAAEQSQTLLSQGGTYVERILPVYAAVHDAMERASEPTAERDKILTREELDAVRAPFIRRNADWLEYVQRNAKDAYSPEDLKGLFTELIALRAERDPRWAAWRVIIEPGKDMVSVLSPDTTISIGADRAPASHDEALTLTAHELGIHATRNLSGIGPLPGYIDMEESLGILAELFVTGRMPVKAQDRYLDIALAMGSLPGLRLTRSELIEFGLNRSLARLEAAGAEIDQKAVAHELKKVNTHVNRIFRGGDGRDEGAPAVFTKDAVYFPAKLERYLAKQLRSGVDPEELLDFLLCGKFDPTNELHLKRLEELGVKPPKPAAPS